GAWPQAGAADGPSQTASRAGRRGGDIGDLLWPRVLRGRPGNLAARSSYTVRLLQSGGTGVSPVPAATGETPVPPGNRHPQPDRESGVMGHTLSEVLADFVSSATEASVPAGVRASVRRRLLDTVGDCLAAVPVDTSRAVVEYVCAEGGAAEATAVGLARRLPAAQAAFVNGVLARTVEFDDTALPAILHPSGVVIPAALAAGPIGRRSGLQVL